MVASVPIASKTSSTTQTKQEHRGRSPKRRGVMGGYAERVGGIGSTHQAYQ